MSRRLPTVSGHRMISLLVGDGWTISGHCPHGVVLRKQFGKRYRITTIQNISKPLKKGTLHAILSLKQTGLGRKGLFRLTDKKRKKKRKKPPTR